MIAGWNIHQGDALAVLRTLPDGIAQTCVTSPPYWGLRDYGVAGQLGLERTPAEYVAHMVEVFHEVRRVLRDDGTLWLNLGDSYAGSWGAQSREHAGKHAPNISAISANQLKAAQIRNSGTGSLSRTPGLKPKDLVGIPWRVAFALQADGWYLRSDIIWAKPNPMPESVTDRPTKAHEYLFLMAKAERYFYDADAIKEAGVTDDRPRSSWENRREVEPVRRGDPSESGHVTSTATLASSSGRNRRSVWTVATQPFNEAHFATFPPKLIEPCILAGSRPGDLVIDPFNGAGTTGLVSLRLQRRYLGIELNPAYIEMSRRRLEDDAPLFNRAVLP